jgi:hypothetical protein
MIIELCVAACQQAGHVLVNVEYAQECYCDSIFCNDSSAVPGGNTLCNMARLGIGPEICGGPNQFHLFTFGG